MSRSNQGDAADAARATGPSDLSPASGSSLSSVPIARKARAFLLKLGNGESPPTYRTVAGLRELVEVTGEGSSSITGQGIFLGAFAEAEVRAHALSGDPADCQLSFETGERMTAPFIVKRVEFVGDFNGERNYLVQIDSAGPVQFERPLPGTGMRP